MSRTIKGEKSPGYEYWSRRPNRGICPSKNNKKTTHRLERRKAERDLKRINLED